MLMMNTKNTKKMGTRMICGTKQTLELHKKKNVIGPVEMIYDPKAGTFYCPVCCREKKQMPLTSFIETIK